MEPGEVSQRKKHLDWMERVHRWVKLGHLDAGKIGDQLAVGSKLHLPAIEPCMEKLKCSSPGVQARGVWIRAIGIREPWRTPGEGDVACPETRWVREQPWYRE